jgi:phosphoglycerate dehydrogenase-like enzyme
MVRILVEDDAYLRIVPVLLDPKITDEHRRALCDFMAHDVPDFEQWLRDLWQQVPGLYPAQVELVMDQDDLRAKLPGADAVILEGLAFGETEIALAPKIAIVQKFGTLIPNIDVVACAKHKIPVNIQKRRVNIAVAEQGFALMIALARRIGETNGKVDAPSLAAAGFDPTPYDRRYTTNSNYSRIPNVKTLYGSTFGAFGMGEIGREVAMRAAAFGMKVIYHQRNRMSTIDEHMIGAEYVSLDELLAKSDFLSMHLPINASTKNIIDRKALAAMKRGAIIINIARAQLIDRDALNDALASGHLGGYGLDVGYEEPALPDEPLKKFKNVILTPHTAIGQRQNGLLDMAEICKKVWRGIIERDETQPLRRSA